MICHPRSWRASPETVLKGGAGSGVLRPRLVTAGSGGPGHRPPGMTTWLRGARCTDPEAMPEMEARPPAENRHGGAPRGERPASWDAPHPAGCGQVAPHPRDNRTSAPVGAPPAPRSGTDAITRTNPGAERAAGTMKAALFDIVRRDCGQRLMREPRLRARYDESQPEAVGWVEFLRDPTMAPQGDCCAWRGAQPKATRCWVSQEARPNLRLLREPCAGST